jgi:hypothetical protein
VRKFLILVLTSLVAIGVSAAELAATDTDSQVASTQSPSGEALVTIAPVPMPALVIEQARYLPERTTLRQAKRVKAAKVARVKSMLSRSAREQIALSRTSSKPDERAHLTASEHEDMDGGNDALDLHRSFSQPKVAKGPDQADEEESAADELSDHVKLRLLIARTKAVEAYIQSQQAKASSLADDELSDTVKLRLYIARARAVKAHSEKFGAA